MTTLTVDLRKLNPRSARVAPGLICASMAIALSSCAIKRVDFDGYLDRSIGRPLVESEYDSMIAGTGRRSLRSETDESLTYEYQPQGSKCAWEVVVAKRTLQVKSWRYLTDEAKRACHDLPATRGV
jgi:hypothetical protein